MSTAAGSLAQDMLLAFRDQQLSDITVTAFGQTFYLHRLILLRSGYFRSMILGQVDWVEKSRQAITIHFDSPNVTLQSFQRIIHWLYGIDFHYTEGSAPLMFRSVPEGNSRGATEGLSQQHTPPVSGGRPGLGQRQGTAEYTTEKLSINGSGNISVHRYDNIMMDPSDKVDELLISMYATASYLNITALTEEICSDIAHRIRDSRGLIHYMEYAWKLNNGKAWDIILAHCFYQFSWYTYRSFVLQEMLVSPDMPIAGLVKVLVSESLWVPSEYERYQLIKGIMLRRLDLDMEKLMDWIYEYHNHDWFMILKELDDNGVGSGDVTSDAFLYSIQDWESNSTTEYEDAVDSDHEWVSTTTKEIRRRSSQIGAMVKLTPKDNEDDDDDRTSTPTAETTTSILKSDRNSSQEPKSPELNTEEPSGTSQQQSASLNSSSESKVPPRSPTLGTPISSPALSALSITSDTLPRHQVRDLLILMYILHHSIHYTHMGFDQLHQVLSEGLVLPARVKDAFWRQHLLRRISVSTSSKLPYLASQPASPHIRRHGAEATHHDKTTRSNSTVPRVPSSLATPSIVSSPSNSYGLLPIRFSTSLYISRRDLMTDGKHFTNSTFYGGSWWSIQVGNNLNADGQVGVFLSAAPTPRAVPNYRGRLSGSSRSGRSGGTGLFAAFRSDQQTTSATGSNSRRSFGESSTSGKTEGGAGGDSSSIYNRQRELTCNYRIYMTTNVVEPPQYFAAAAVNRLDEIRGGEYSGGTPNLHQHQKTNNSNANDALRARFGFSGGAEAMTSSLSTSPEMISGSFTRQSLQKIAAEDEMIGEDTFKLNEGWGYRHLRYLTRVARQVRDQPPRTSQPSLPTQESSRSTMPLSPRIGALGAQQPQQGNQQVQAQPAQQQQQAHHEQHQQNQQPQPLQQQQQQQQLHQQQQQQQQTSTSTPVTSSSTVYGAVNDEAEDDGLWIHFVVKVGWSDGTKAEIKTKP
ncbi:Germ cell-less protein-like 1 [Entomortierella lignicola]|nr:Germ cell-less protein-like 1 [Entomortierella lignicola]